MSSMPQVLVGIQDEPRGNSAEDEEPKDVNLLKVSWRGRTCWSAWDDEWINLLCDGTCTHTDICIDLDL